MKNILQLGYVSLGASDLVKTKEYYHETMGLVETDSDAKTSFLSIGNDHHNILLRQEDTPGLMQLGYELKPQTDVEAFAASIKDFGLAPVVKSDPQPGITKMIEVTAPGDNVMQFYVPAETEAPGFQHRGIAPIRLGHVAVITPEAPKLVEFYRDCLGFYETDWVGDIANFLTCTEEHHVINIVHAPISKVHHIAFQLHEASDHVRVADMLKSKGMKTEWGPSRHTAGHNLAAYHYDPDRVLIELYTDMDVFIPEKTMCYPRPWHEHLPMKPRKWGMDELSSWEVDFQFDLATA